MPIYAHIPFKVSISGVILSKFPQRMKILMAQASSAERLLERPQMAEVIDSTMNYVYTGNFALSLMTALIANFHNTIC